MKLDYTCRILIFQMLDHLKLTLNEIESDSLNRLVFAVLFVSTQDEFTGWILWMQVS